MKMNQLPFEVCEQIFKNLPPQELLTARRTCHRWKQIVDGSPTLMNRIHLKPLLRVMDRSCRPLCSIPARRVTLKDTTVLTVDSWWSSIGQELVVLRLENCLISTETLVKMLQKAPNLRFMSYACDNDVAEAESDFTLDKLEHLEVYSAQSEILDVFGVLCPRLKHFRFGQQNEARKLGEFLLKLKNTLETIQLISVENILGDVLKLTELTSLDVQSDTFRNETLKQIGAALPKLNSLRVTLQWQHRPMRPTFLNSMPELTCLTIFGQYRLDSPSIAIDFGGLEGLHKLEKMHLTRFKPANLKKFLHKSDHFFDLTLHYCEFNNWSELFAMLASFKNLERLDLGKLRIPVEDITVTDLFVNLKYLKMTHCNLYKNTLKSFTQRCANLIEIDCNCKTIFDKETERSLCFTWKRCDGMSINKLFDSLQFEDL